MIDQTNAITWAPLLTGAAMRRCKVCPRWLPPTEEHWQFNKSGRKAGKIAGRVCRVCARERARERSARPEAKQRQREYTREYNAKPENRQRQREYDSRPESKQRAREREAQPENRQRKRERDSRPESKQRARELRDKPEARQRTLEYNREYVARPENRQRKRKYDVQQYRDQRRAQHRVMYNALSQEEQGPVLRQIMREHRWRALRDRQPHVVYCYSKGSEQYIGLTWRDVYQRLREHCEADISACYEWLADGIMPLVEVLHRCDNRADALTLEAQEIEQRRAAGITLLNRT